MCVHAHVSDVCGCTCVGVHAHGALNLVSEVFFVFKPYPLISHPNPEPRDIASITSQLALGSPVSFSKAEVRQVSSTSSSCRLLDI